MKRPLQLAGWALLALLVLSVVVARIGGADRRSFEWVELAETDYSEIAFRNLEQDLRLAGMLFVPDGEGPFPAAVIIHGSGPSVRDNGWYLTLTRYLQLHGVVVLLPDKRGSERSEGRWKTASYEDLATDTVAAVRHLRQQDRVDLSAIGVIGLSQGGRIAPLVARRVPDLAFVVNIVGGAVPGHDALVYEENHNLREMGVPPGLSDLLARPAAWSLIHLRDRSHWDAVGNFDPVDHWRKVTVDSLVLYGEDDTNVPTEESVAALRALESPHIEVRTYAGSGHALESPRGQGDSIFREDALHDIRRFIFAALGEDESTAGPEPTPR